MTKIKESINIKNRTPIFLIIIIILTELVAATLYCLSPLTVNASANGYVHNFTESGKTSDYFKITGNLTTNQGTVTYENLTLTTALKIESSTLIVCNVKQKSELTLVFNPTFNGSIKILNKNVRATNGIVKIEVDQGALSIEKADSANLYYMALEPLEEETKTETPIQPSEPSEVNATLNSIQESLYVLIGVMLWILGAFLGYVAISRLM